MKHILIPYKNQKVTYNSVNAMNTNQTLYLFYIKKMESSLKNAYVGKCLLFGYDLKQKAPLVSLTSFPKTSNPFNAIRYGYDEDVDVLHLILKYRNDLYVGFIANVAQLSLQHALPLHPKQKSLPAFVPVERSVGSSFSELRPYKYHSLA